MTTTKKEATKCKHSFFVTNWMQRGGQERATEVRCMYCLKHICLDAVCVAEWKEKEGIDV